MNTISTKLLCVSVVRCPGFKIVFILGSCIRSDNEGYINWGNGECVYFTVLSVKTKTFLVVKIQ